MYTRANVVSSGLSNIVNYVKGEDIYNSKLIELLRDPGLERKEYEITTFEYRPDLIANEVYGSSEYESLVMIQTGTTLTNYKKGETLMLIPKAKLDSLLRSI